jgi:hypothetical protein
LAAYLALRTQPRAALPTLARNRPFAMVEIERALGTQGRFISEVAIRLGWRRQRIWTGAGPFHRYWLPPSVAAVASERPSRCPRDRSAPSSVSRIDGWVDG